MPIEKALYVAHAKATSGNDPRVTSSEGELNVKLDVPKALGGSGGSGTNPEQLFAAGYAACFLSAMKFVAVRDKIAMPSNASIESDVSIGKIPNGFGLEAALKITLPGMDRAAAHALIEKADIVCPFSNTARNNIDVTLTLVE